jgi:hypothetical protein
MSPRWGFTPRLTASRNVTLTLAVQLSSAWEAEKFSWALQGRLRSSVESWSLAVQLSSAREAEKFSWALQGRLRSSVESWSLTVQLSSAREAEKFSWALQGRLRNSVELCKGGWEIQLRVESPVVKKRVSCKNAAVKRRFYVYCSYSENVIITVLKSVARIRLVKFEKT